MKQRSRKSFVNVVLILIAYTICTAVFLAIFGAVFGETTENYHVRASLTTICSYPIMLLLLLVQNPKVEGMPAEKPRKNGIMAWLLVVILAMAASFAANNLILFSGLSQLSSSYEATSAELYSGSFGLMAIDSILLAPLMEEIVYRGLIYRQFKRSINALSSAFVTAAIFGAMHMNIVQFVYAGLMGLVLCFVIEYTGSLIASILAHIVMNGFAVMRTMMPATIYGANSQIFVYVQTTVACVITVIIVSIMIRTMKKNLNTIK